jgi:protein required for attachment to host cells
MKRICLVVADAARARIYTYQQLLEPDGPHDELREERDLIDSARRKRASELFSNGSGTNHTGHHGYAFDDHREAHLANLDAAFAHEISDEIARITRDQGYRDVLVVASARMLGALRTKLEPLRRTLTITELERDYTKLTTAQLRDQLSALELLPARPRHVGA